MLKANEDHYWNFTDEVEKTENKMQRDELRHLLRYIYANQLASAIVKVREYVCEGCKIDHPSQTQHSCLYTDWERSFYIYDTTTEGIDESRLKAIFIEAAHILWLNHKDIDIDSTLQEYLECWVTTSFVDFEASLETTEESFITATAAATSKLNLLEERFTKQ